MNIIIFLCILIIIYIFWANLHLKEKFSNIDCQGGWLPWQKKENKKCDNDTGLPLFSRSYKIIKLPENNGSDCPFYNGKKQDISCNKPKPDDCLEIRARYYNSSDPTEEMKIKKCNMDNCIPPKFVNANCSNGLIIVNKGGINEKISKRCPWICDPKKKLQGDGINSCSYDSDCAKCSPINLFDNTSCGDTVACPNPLADDGCGYYNIIDGESDLSKNLIVENSELEIIQDNLKKDYSKYIKPIKKDKTYNKYNLQKPDPPKLYKSLYDYIPFNSVHSFF